MKIASVYTIIATIFLAITSCKTNEPSNITIIEEGDYNVIVMNKEAMKFGVSEGKPENADFYIIIFSRLLNLRVIYLSPIPPLFLSFKNIP